GPVLYAESSGILDPLFAGFRSAVHKTVGAVCERPQCRNRDIAGGPRSASAAARSLKEQTAPTEGQSLSVTNTHRPGILPPFFYANYGPIVMMVIHNYKIVLDAQLEL